MVQMSKGEVPQSNSVAEMISYVSFQELATQVAHRNTGQALDKTRRGKKIMSKVAGDEGLHHAFYRDLVLAASRSTPRRWWSRSRASCATSRCPGRASPVSPSTRSGNRARRHLRRAAVRRGSREADTRCWRLFDLEGLSDEAERAREKIDKNVAGLTRLAAAQQVRIAEMQG